MKHFMVVMQLMAQGLRIELNVLSLRMAWRADVQTAPGTARGGAATVPAARKPNR